MDTAIRETEEESGIRADQIKIMEFRKELYYRVGQKDKTVIYWLAELLETDTRVVMSEEHKDYRWAALDEACRLAEYPDMQELLRECQDFLNVRYQL